MSKIIRINSRAKTDESTGYGTNGTMYGGRLMKKDGQPNIEKNNIGFFERLSWYHTMIKMARWKFLGLIFVFFLAVNLVFAIIYYSVGVEHLGGMQAETVLQKFTEAYFFSAQTFTTVGYGRINPTGYLMSFIAAFEAFSGLLFFAIATGLFYARFSRPKAFLKFSHNAVIAPFREGIALMCRMVPFKNNYLTDAEVQLTLAMIIEENGTLVNRFYPLELQISKINALTLSWTLVHPINDQSPMYNLSQEDLKNYKAEVLVFVKAFDDTFSNTVVARTSYHIGEVLFGAKFVPMYNRSQNGTSTIMEMDKLNEMVEADISTLMSAKQSAEK
jgi:inward rectifier potassium channel